nr:OprD family outer membrane porin [uncultured Marinobacter sp.]
MRFNNPVIALAFSCFPTVLLASDFLSESQASAQYLQYYWNEDQGDGVGPIRDEWVHALRLDYQSGYYRNLIGFDVGFGAADALAIGKGVTSVTNLPTDNGLQNPDAIAKPITAYLKLRTGTGDHQFRFGWGKKVRRYHLYSDSTTRILPAASIGVDLSYEFQSLRLYGASLERFSPRNEAGWGEDLRTFDGQSIDRVDLVGLDYMFPRDFRVEAEYVLSKNYLEASLVRLSHDVAISAEAKLSMALAHGRQSDAGHLFEQQGVPGLFPSDRNHESRYNELTMKLQRPGYYLGAAFTKVNGDHYERVLFSRDYGTWDSAADNFYRFGLAGEAMWKLSAGIDLTSFGLEGLRWDGYYARSDGADDFSGFSRSELLSFLKYRFPGKLKGLSISWLHVAFDTNGEPKPGTGQIRSFGPAGIITHDADRLYLSYSYDF